jgi:hypothetical protein
MAWLAVALPAVAFSAAGIPARFTALQQVCTSSGCGQWGAAPTPEVAHYLQTLGLSLAQYAAYTVAIEVATSSVYFVVSALLLWRTHTLMSVFVAIVLAAFGALSTNVPDAFAGTHPLLQTPVALLDALGLASLTIFLYVFPNGRFVPRWTGPLAAAVALWYCFIFLYPGGVLQPMHSLATLIAEAALFVVGVGTQAYRYRTVSSPIEQQQTKWVVFGIAVALITSVILLFAGGAAPSANPLVLMAEDTLFAICGAVTPVTIAIAVLHYRLYDIDTLANRTLVYGSLTITLATVYLGSVILLQSLFRALTGQRTDLAIAIATLIIAALFNPWRRRLQVFIDRRFYRRKYDASRVLAAFSSRLRDEVDLARLEIDILTTVTEAIQPEQASLWLPEYGGGQ